MDKFFEEEASFMRSGGSWYMLVPPHMRDFIGITTTNNNTELITDAKIAIAIGKHGKFIFAYSPKQQKRYQREKAKGVD